MDPDRVQLIRKFSLRKAKGDFVVTIGLVAMQVGLLCFASSLWGMSQSIISFTPISEDWCRGINSVVICFLFVFASFLALFLVWGSDCGYLMKVGLVREEKGVNNKVSHQADGVFCNLMMTFLLLIAASDFATMILASWTIWREGYEPDMLEYNRLVTIGCILYTCASIMSGDSQSTPLNDTLLKNCALKHSLNALAERMSVEYDKIIVRGDHYLPHVEGLFTKNLILNKNLVKTCTIKEALALVAHGTTRRTFKTKFALAISSILASTLILLMFFVMVGNPSMYASLGFSRHEFLVGFTLWLMVFIPTERLVRFAVNCFIHNRFENQVRSCMKLSYGDSLKSALCKQFQGEWMDPSANPLCYHNLVHADPIYAQYYLDEAGLADRLAIIENMTAECGAESKV